MEVICTVPYNLKINSLQVQFSIYTIIRFFSLPGFSYFCFVVSNHGPELACIQKFVDHFHNIKKLLKGK